MLNLGEIFPQVENMVIDSEMNIINNKQKLKTAAGIMAELNNNFDQILNKVTESKTSWLVAVPLENVHNIHHCPPVPRDYAVVASDGSQLFPEHHQMVLCYLINTGAVLLRYGTKSQALLTNYPKLYYREEDLYMSEDGVKRLVDQQRVSAVRNLAEAYTLADLAGRYLVGDDIGVALSDGTLIHWSAEQQGKWSGVFLNRLMESYELLRHKGVPLAGYISNTRSTDVINMLRVALCSQIRADCDHCSVRGTVDAPCESITGIRDASLFKGMLGQGERSAVFGSTSKVLDKYGPHRVYFFYVNVGHEVARVEIPKWVTEKEEYINRVHAVVVDQALKGKGYPTCLSEAHHQAVITGSDRELFYQLVNQLLVKRGLPSEISYKSLSKRRVPV